MSFDNVYAEGEIVEIWVGYVSAKGVASLVSQLLAKDQLFVALDLDNALMEAVTVTSELKKATAIRRLL